LQKRSIVSLSVVFYACPWTLIPFLMGQLLTPIFTTEEQRAYDLNREFPKQNVPVTLDRPQYKALKDQYTIQLKQQKNPQVSLPARPLAPQQTKSRGANPRGRQRQRSSQRTRMLPPSEARRAEVARNLMGNSNNEPITLD